MKYQRMTAMQLEMEVPMNNDMYARWVVVLAVAVIGAILVGVAVAYGGPPRVH